MQAALDKAPSEVYGASAPDNVHGMLVYGHPVEC